MWKFLIALGMKCSSRLLFFMAWTTLSSCYLTTSPEDRVLQNKNEIEAEYLGEFTRQSQGKSSGKLKVSWSQAIEKMYMHNPELLQADFKVEDAVNQQKRVWTNLIPLVSVGVSDSFELDNIEDAFKDINLRVYSYLPLNEVVRLPKQIYTKKILYMASQLNAEHTMRQQVIALYRLFQKQYLLGLEYKAIQLEGALTKGISIADDPELIRLRKSYADALDTWSQNYEEWRVQVGDFFMNDYSEIELMRKSLPDISYKPSDLNFSDSGRWGMLQLNLLAIEKISKDAEILDTYLRYFPSPNFNVSAPPLYNDTGSSAFDPAEIRLGPSLNWSLDTRGLVGEQLNRIKRERPLTDWRDDKRQREEVKKLVDGKTALVEIQAELKKTRSAMSVYTKIVKSGLIEDPRQAVRTMRMLREREVRLAAKEIEIYSTFWLIDEKRWTKTTKRWQVTRQIRADQRKEQRELQEKLEKEAKKNSNS